MVAGMSRTHPVYSLQADQYFQQFTKGDETAFGQLYKQFYKPLLRHGLKIIADEFIVNSSIQEAFLKAWNFRERMASVLHTYRFLRLNVTWKCYDYYRQPNQFHQRIIYTDNIDNYTKGCYLADSEHEEQVFAISEERLQAIDKVISYLPATRKTIFTLYFKYGLTHRQIAKRFSSSRQFISAELQKGLEDLKKVIHTAKKLDTPVIPRHTDTGYPECLQGELLQLFRWFAAFEVEKEEHSFDASIIAEASLSLDYPIIVKIGKSRHTIGDKEEFLYRRLAIQSARQRVQHGITFARSQHGRKRKLKGLDRFKRQEHNYVAHKLHLYSRRLIELCIKNKAATLLLVNQQSKEEAAQADNFLLRNWSYYSLKEKILYKAAKAGIEVIIE